MTGHGQVQIYEITFRGSLTRALRHAFDDLEVVQDQPDTVLRGPLGDQAALQGVLQRVLRLGLELVEVHECEGPRASADPHEDAS